MRFPTFIQSLAIIFVVLLAFSSSSFADREKDTIAWLEAVAPPFFIHDGPLKGQGYEDLITDIIKKQLVQYEHQHQQATISRHHQQWKQGEKACSLAMFKTPERMDFAYFSIPSVFTLPPVLIIHKKQFEQFGKKKTVSLKKILQSNNFIIGRSNNRSYGSEFDNILNKYGNEQNVFTYESQQLSMNLFKMLLAGRIDALPGLPEEAMYLAETLGFRNDIMTIMVEENQGNHSSCLTYVACSKTPWGKKTIVAINEVLIKQRPTIQYRTAYERWLDPSSIDGYRQLYDDVFLKITK